VTMRLIAERLLDNADGTTYVDGELISHKLKALPPPTDEYHVCCSGRNPGALELIQELAKKRNFELKLTQALGRRGSSGVIETVSLTERRRSEELMPQISLAKRPDSQAKEVLFVTMDVTCLAKCDHMLLYLSSQTWTRGEASEMLGKEVDQAMDLGVHVLLAHEMPGDGEQARSGCEFGSFFSCADGTTPGELLKRGIYSEIAVALKGGPWREASMAMLAMAFGLSKEEAEARAAGEDVLGDIMKIAENSLYHGLTKMRSDLGSRVRRLSGNMSGRFGVAAVGTSSKSPHRAEENSAAKSAATFDPLEIEAGEGGDNARSAI